MMKCKAVLPRKQLCVSVDLEEYSPRKSEQIATNRPHTLLRVQYQVLDHGPCPIPPQICSQATAYRKEAANHHGIVPLVLGVKDGLAHEGFLLSVPRQFVYLSISQ